MECRWSKRLELLEEPDLTWYILEVQNDKMYCMIEREHAHVAGLKSNL